MRLVFAVFVGKQNDVIAEDHKQITQLPTVAAQADAALQEVSQTLPQATAEVASDQTPQPKLIEPVPVAPSPEEEQLINLYNRVNPGVVTIYMTTGSGSGFIVDADGYIATGLISDTTIFTLSPGITISTPSGSWQAPVMSVVRK